MVTNLSLGHSGDSYAEMVELKFLVTRRGQCLYINRFVSNDKWEWIESKECPKCQAHEVLSCFTFHFRPCGNSFNFIPTVNKKCIFSILWQMSAKLTVAYFSVKHYQAYKLARFYFCLLFFLSLFLNLSYIL